MLIDQRFVLVWILGGKITLQLALLTLPHNQRCVTWDISQRIKPETCVTRDIGQRIKPETCVTKDINQEYSAAFTYNTIRRERCAIMDRSQSIRTFSFLNLHQPCVTGNIGQRI